MTHTPRLYRIESWTFEEYCQIRFKMSKGYAHRLMTGAPIAREMVPTGTVSEGKLVDGQIRYEINQQILAERAVRELKKVAPEKRQEVFQKATETARAAKYAFYPQDAELQKVSVSSESAPIGVAVRTLNSTLHLSF